MPKPKRKSRPTRARGLKLVVDVVADAVVESRPTRARGLKRVCGDGWRMLAGRAPRGRVD